MKILKRIKLMKLKNQIYIEKLKKFMMKKIKLKIKVLNQKRLIRKNIIKKLLIFHLMKMNMETKLIVLNSLKKVYLQK